MKFLIHSNAPTIATGYGVQTAYLADRLAEAGHEVAVSCTYGHQGLIGSWKSPKGHDIRLYPAGYETNGNDVLHNHADHFFDGDPSQGWIIPLLDVWCLVNPLLADFQVAAWAPVDHLPCPPDVLKFFHRTGATPIAMSRFGEHMFAEAGLDPLYVPLSVDTKAFKPTYQLDIAGEPRNAREIFEVPLDAFVVGMVAMNKGWARDRKGFNEAFRAFGEFWRRHNNAVLLVHAEKFGAAEGINLPELAGTCGIPPHAIVFSNQYAYRLGMPSHMMAALYTAMDVLLAPSHGEGFGVPMIEAQACGTPVIASDFSSQSELIGVGWKVEGQPEWDPAQHASYICPFISSVLAGLESAYAADLAAMQVDAVEWAQQYDTDRVFDEMWLPVISSLMPFEPEPQAPMETVDVIIPLVRSQNEKRLLESLEATWPKKARGKKLVGSKNKTYAENVNALVARSKADWVLVVGDDVEFTPGWFEAAADISEGADVIGTYDAPGAEVRNPDVAAGHHADHFFIRRDYIDSLGASLDGPGTTMSTAYRHWYTDKELVQLAKARGVFKMAPGCVIVHHHPGYAGDEAGRQSDPIYMKAVESAEVDQRTFLERRPLIDGHRISRGK
ncbi:MAG TPA: glycosyltransferase [Ilumatobacteraceae bacterium]|nr:glycosyltransferase [Ilumatobacteraceae bacterium]